MLKSKAFREPINKSTEESNGNFLWRYLNLKKFIPYQQGYCNQNPASPKRKVHFV